MTRVFWRQQDRPCAANVLDRLEREYPEGGVPLGPSIRAADRMDTRVRAACAPQKTSRAAGAGVAGSGLALGRGGTS